MFISKNNHYTSS